MQSEKRSIQTYSQIFINKIRPSNYPYLQNVKDDSENKNIILSPLSIQMALGLASIGARGKTEQELLTGLKFAGAQRSAVANSFQQLIEPFQNNPMLKIANKLYVMTGYHVKGEFNEIATKQFHSEAEPINFAAAKPAADNINGWVESKTNNLIKDLIKADSLSSDTRMVLVNAIYFKGFWKHQFPKHATIKAPFYTSETDSVEIDTMHVKEHFRYGEFTELDAKAIEMPYKDSDMSMIIILPNSRTGLSALEDKLQTVNLSELSKKMCSVEVTVSLPKFKVEYEISLPEVLKKVRIKKNLNFIR